MEHGNTHTWNWFKLHVLRSDVYRSVTMVFVGLSSCLVPNRGFTLQFPENPEISERTSHAGGNDVRAECTRTCMERGEIGESPWKQQ